MAGKCCRGECRRYKEALMAEYHRYPALPPVFGFIDNEPPRKVRKVKTVWTEDTVERCVPNTAMRWNGLYNT